MFRDLFVRRGFEYDYVFDWTILKYMESLQQEVGSSLETTTSIGRSTLPRNKSPTACFAVCKVSGYHSEKSDIFS